jgi:hypothetical protein
MGREGRDGCSAAASGEAFPANRAPRCTSQEPMLTHPRFAGAASFPLARIIPMTTGFEPPLRRRRAEPATR